MFALLSLLFAGRPMRNFALLDSRGWCRALRQSVQPPSGSGWVEVRHIGLHWLNKPLPAEALTHQVTAQPLPAKALTA